MSLSIVQYPQKVVDGNPLFLSKWDAINHPILFKLQRRDFNGLFYYNNTDNVLTIAITGTLPTTPLLPGDQVFVGDPNNPQIFVVDQFLGVNVIVMLPKVISGTLAASGYINLLSRVNYFIRTNIYGVSESGQYELIGQSINRPDSKGIGTVDVSSFIKNVVGYENDFKYNKLNWGDQSLGTPYNITYSENWNEFEGEFSGISQTELRYGVNAAKQIQDLYGSNMGEYVTFFDDSLSPVDSPLAKFLSDFDEPTYFPGYPFSLSFIYSDDLAGISTNKMEDTKNINGFTVSSEDPIELDNTQVREVNRLTIKADYSKQETKTEVWLETEGDISCVNYVADAYVAEDYVEEQCGVQVIELPDPGEDSPPDSVVILLGDPMPDI